MPLPQNENPQGQQDHYTNLDPSIALSFFVQQLLNDMQTVALVEVVNVTNSGGLSEVGFVDVRPLVNQVTGRRDAVPHGVIHGIPYFRLQGGTDAIIIDPKMGDIGMCGFCSRDSSGVVATKKAANPNSSRKYNWADGLYFGGFLNGTPSQYIRFSAEGIELVSPTKIKLDAPEVEVTGKLTVTGLIKSLTDVLAKTISLFSHRHDSSGKPT